MKKEAKDWKKEKSNWKTVVVTTDTHTRLSDEKIMKSPGVIENYDDVIRRKIGWPYSPVKQEENKS